MAHFAALALNGIPPLIQNYDTIVESARQRVQGLSIPGRRKSRNRKDDGYQSDYEYKYTSRPGNMDRSRGRDRGGPQTAPLASQDVYLRRRPSSIESIPRAFPPPGSEYNPRNTDPRSAGRNPYSPGAGRGSRRDYHPQSQLHRYFSLLTFANSTLGARRYESSSDSDSDSDSSPPPRQKDRHRRNTVGDAALEGAAAAGVYSSARASENKNTRGSDYSQSSYRDNDEGNGGRSRNKTKDKSKVKSNDKSKDKSKDKNKKVDSSDEDSGDDSSSMVPSSEDERLQKHMRAKELLTAGLAAVATVHAASGVYNSMEARDKRMEKLREGKISPEEARKERTKALVQDFAAVGVAALSIKGAMSKWQGATELHRTRKQHKQAKAERHQKKLEKASTYNEKSNNGGSQSNSGSQMAKSQRPGYNRSYSRSEPDLSRQPYNAPHSGTPGRYVPAQYRDDNPYGPYGRR